ncbi:class I SAM-dependent RNA methyltransferase [Leucobacter sp. OH1287]|uniref:class I SAM-dependent RNA methyltransferase n=1 Tax=Leucobacter sp. OH1287 TaxID=2491049 RepID=UPI000F5F7063|nr:TRAM domain-containing protein [Leucobacter sp. OH1287]RRD61157.1 class I SAM-dependent RNA methyltransferase [Leucobacter sp. OH1287]
MTEKTESAATDNARKNPGTAALSAGDTLELEVTGIAHGGLSIARHEGRVVFVADTLPGERVRARLTEVKKSFARATAVSVVEASPKRQDHIWAEASINRQPEMRVGGAEFGHIELSHQRELKAQVLADAMRRQAKLNSEIATAAVIEALPGDDDAGLGWRTRVRLHVDPETGRVGPYAARSHRVIPVKSLPLAVPELAPLAPLNDLLPDAQHVDLVAPSGDDPRLLITHRGEKTAVGAGDVITEYAAGLPFRVRAGGFWQVHREAASTLFEQVASAVEWLGDAVDPAAANLDLYGGVGLLVGGFIAGSDSRARITSIESDEAATDLAAENLATAPGAQTLNAKTEDYLADLLRSSGVVRQRVNRGTVVLDPPRSGAGGRVTAQLLELAPQNIIYVACDPVALARDTQTLVTGGYELTALRGFDLFPHTHHFESIAIFERI